MKHSGLLKGLKRIRGRMSLGYWARVVLRLSWLTMGAGLVLWALRYGETNETYPALALMALAVLLVLLLESVRLRGEIKSFAWRADRAIGLGEQFSAAVELRQVESQIERELMENASKMLHVIEDKVRRSALTLRADLQALAVMLLLTLMLFLDGVSQYTSAGFSESLPVPGLSSEPTLSDVFSSNLIGQGQTSDGTFGGSQGGGAITPDFSFTAGQELRTALSELGQAVQQRPSTGVFGQYLEEGEYSLAATELERIGERLPGLDRGTVSLLADSLEDAAESLQSEELQQFREELQNGARVTLSGNEVDVLDAYSGLAGLLAGLEFHQTSDELSEEEVAEWTEHSSYTQQGRLGEGGPTFTFIPDEGQAALIQPSIGTSLSDTALISGETDFFAPVAEGAPQFAYEPPGMVVEWTDLIKKYFLWTLLK